MTAGLPKTSAIVLLGLAMTAAEMSAQERLPDFLQDRGTGVSTSLFGTYVKKGKFLVYPFYEYAKASKDEYHGSELGFVGDIDYLGQSETHEAVLFLAYGITDDLAVELEGEVFVTQTLKSASDDTTTGMPAELEESGLGDVEGQIRWRLLRETESRPEFFTNFEVAFPLQKEKVLIGTSEWEFAAGVGAVKGFSWGTLTTRLSVGYDGEEEEVKLGEYAIEYLKRLSKAWRLVTTIEGEDDELSLVLEAQWHISPHVFWKFNSGFGLSEKAEDFAPEIGLMFSF
jgi:hypothetical protein